MNSRSFVLLLVLTCFAFFSCTAFAQSGTTSTGQEETISAGYVIHQSTELGYRFNDQTGNSSLYDTFVNLQQGPRVLEQSLSMQSENHAGLLFDNLFVNSFGWGGEPNNALRLRADKYKWYNFQASFRRDQNYFDYNLLANPLNPSNSSPTVQVGNSPHEFQTRRKMSDLDLTILPQSFINFRLGYSRGSMSGPSFNSIHEGADVLLSQPWNTTQNAYRFGVDVKVLPRTVLSYDQFLDYYKNDTYWQLAPYTQALLPGGQPVELGLPMDTVNKTPCALTGGATSLIDANGYLTNLGCNGYVSYFRNQNVRSSIPTERLSLRSSYWRRLDLTAGFSYSGSDSRLPDTNEIFAGLVSRTAQRAFDSSGLASANRVATAADLGLTFHITDKFRIVDTFRFDNQRSPSAWNVLTSSLFGATLVTTPNVFDPATCPAPYTAATCPQHGNSSGADVTGDSLYGFFKLDQKVNTIKAVYDFTRHISGNIGYRFQRHNIVHNTSDFQELVFYPNRPNRGACAGLPLDADGVCRTSAITAVIDTAEVNAHSLLAGISLKPVNSLRFTLDTEQFFSDDSETRISPRKQSLYRIQSTYTPRRWAVIGTTLNLAESSNDDLLTKFVGHNRNYGFTATLTPRERFGLDLAYNYSDFMQNALICFNDTPATGVVLPVVTGASTCSRTVDPANPYNDAANPLLTNSYYKNNTHFGMATVVFKPVKHVTTQLGYNITNVDGHTPQFNILQPLGSLQYTYHQPVAQLGVDLGHNLAWNTGWNYYQYKEGSFVGPTDSRYFHANSATLSLNYSF